MPAGRFDYTGEAARFAPFRRQRASAVNRRWTEGLAFVAMSESGSAWIRNDV